jgi:two-component system response regulator HydG
MTGETLSERSQSDGGFQNIVGRAPAMETLYRLIAKAARSTHPVLILGESGTGKEMLAKAIHYAGPRGDKPFVPVDCASLVPTLVESELFGYAKGAFTGASHSKVGLLAMAEGGTIFLDEVGELPIDLQAKLLRTLQEKEIRPIGSTNPIPMKARILAATNRDLEQAVAKGLFREDLYFRLNVLSLRVPPLRERREDIPLLVRRFLDRDGLSSGKAPEITDDTMRALMAYDWPGNVRELENCVECCCAMTSGPFIHVADLPDSVTRNSRLAATLRQSTITTITTIAELERSAISSTLAQLNGDKLSAARRLGIGKTTLYRRLKEYGAELERRTA